MKYISRKLYSEHIIPYMNKPIIKVLTGQRRVGKSYVMYELMEKLKEINPKGRIIYINKELEEFADILDHKDLTYYLEGQLEQKSMNYIFIDEIQEIKDFQKSIRSFLLNPTCDIYITGSNAQILSGELASQLSGRYVAFEIHSLGFDEFLNFHGLEENFESVILYLKYGGMPFLHHLGLTEDIPFEYLKNVYATILLKDVVARENIRNVPFLENLVTFLCDNVGSLLSATNIHKYLKSQKINLSVPIIVNYLKALTNSYIIYKVVRSEIGGLKIFEIGEKYYFEDLGIRNTILGYNQKRDLHKLLENAVYMHLRRMGWQIFVGRLEDKEIDFVGDRKGEKIYIQVALTISDKSTEEREFGNLAKILDNYPKYVITLNDPLAGGNYQGIKHLNLLDFYREL